MAPMMMPNQIVPQYMTPQMLMAAPAQMPNDAAAADDSTSTTYDGVDGADASRDTTATFRLTDHVAVRPTNTALCCIWNWITHGEELLTARGGRTDSFKQ